MGFRSTLCSDFHCGVMPDWFKEKYKDQVHFRENSTLVTSKMEFKLYMNDFFEDYSKALNESGLWKKWSDEEVIVLVLGEDGFVSKVVFTSEGIKYYWADGFSESDHVWCEG